MPIHQICQGKIVRPYGNFPCDRWAKFALHFPSENRLSITCGQHLAQQMEALLNEVVYVVVRKLPT